MILYDTKRISNASNAVQTIQFHVINDNAYQSVINNDSSSNSNAHNYLFISLKNKPSLSSCIPQSVSVKLSNGRLRLEQISQCREKVVIHIYIEGQHMHQLLDVHFQNGSKNTCTSSTQHSLVVLR